MDTQNSAPPSMTIAELEGYIEAITLVVNTSDSINERSHYQAVLHDLHQRVQEARQVEAMAGPSSYHNGAQSPSPRSLDDLQRSAEQQDLPLLKRKHRLDADWRASKRVRKPYSPIAPGALINTEAYYTETLPTRVLPSPNAPEASIKTEAYHTETLPTRTLPNAFIDLTGPIYDDSTESNPATPDPFPELVNAYRVPNQGQNDGSSTDHRADAFNQEWMGIEDLASFMVAPTEPGGGYGFQQLIQPQPQLRNGFNNQEVPYFPGLEWPAWAAGAHAHAEDYGEAPLTGVEADAIEKLFENIKDHGETPGDREPTPAIMACTLKEYQKIGLTWLLKMEHGNAKGGILADEMGLGKTVQALSLMCANRSQDPLCKTTLIIAPVALMRQWEKEIERHVLPRHRFTVYLYHGSGKNVDFKRLRTYDVVLTTFGTLTSEFKQKEARKESSFVEKELKDPRFQRKAKDKLALLGRECMWYRVIIDEAHNIKNRNAKSSKAAADLQARHRLCMTGTPMMNSVDELYPLLRFLKVHPYSEWSRFNDDIGKPVKQMHPNARKKAMNRIQILLRSVMLRRQKSSKVDGQEVCTIPPKHTATANVEFSDAEHELYKALETKSQLQMNRFIERNAVTANYANVLCLLLRLRQACCHPHLIKDLSQPATEGIDEYDLLERARMLENHVVARLKAFSSFECPICLEADPNATIIIPCGHTVCGECVQKLVDPTRQEPNEEGVQAAKCPQCRGELHAKLITDYKHFCKVHCPEKLDASDLYDDNSSEDGSDDSDSEDDEDEDVNEKGDLAGFVVSDDDEVTEEEEDGEEFEFFKAEGSELDTPQKSRVKVENKRPPKSRKGKGKGKGKARATPKKTLAQLKKDSLRSKAAKKKYLRRLEKTYIPSAKIEKTMALLAEIAENDPSEKTLIFSQFTSLLDLVEVPLSQRKIRYQRYDGSMKMDERADAVNAFMDDPDENVMLVSLKAGNAGLNLWKASQVIVLDPFWNPFIEDQAVDRAHRMPQPREVHVHRVLVPETVEDRICVLQDKKREIIGAALDEQASKSLTRLDVRELRYLFGMS
ncbi:hypothetical protein IAQ61_000961 [Plenodomus lingam]|uniref:SWI/SNF family DNA-dependent ATPase Ris1 n=1 Tax=Leptosphaeria maculans (strain JN3 / isolate v23.1.3 / race Av1-4-5-6-7-8) TaxID=985895 RepID=E5A2Q7_LEPMJ|nr:hypothetical protein LEMA_P092620.1 [Plenodomus lingam JN3]KAH9880667.1 hypothetical protein IAQ61_000961 [Plenodomus lingam]CBX97853.1 hypothetical protein LEMA_P092620.1 [Plenodomus lingam JN3]